MYCYTSKEPVNWFVDTLDIRLHVNVLGYGHYFMSNRISQLRDHGISVNQTRYASSAVGKYLYTDTIKENSMRHKIT